MRPSREYFRHPIQDQSELMLRDASDQNATCVRSPFLGRLSQEGREVTDVERHHDSLLFGSQGEHLGIVDALQVTALVESEHIMTRLPELVGDHAAGDMCVKQQAQGLSPLSS